MSITRSFTMSGAMVDLAEPEKGQYRISDIAQGLSQICRWHGQTSRFYSVAQHSVVVSHLTSVLMKGVYGGEERDYDDVAKVALLHDASEAYTGDIPQSVKIMIPEFKERIEAPLESAIFKAFGLDERLMSFVKHVDLEICRNEMDSFFHYGAADEVLESAGFPNLKLTSWDPEFAAARFLERYRELFKVECHA